MQDRHRTDPSRPSSEAYLFDPEDWTRRTRALRALAGSIVGREELAEEVVQSAWVRALEHRKLAPSMGWLRRVVRNRAVDLARREALAGKGEVDPEALADDFGPSRIAEQFELQRRVLSVVEELAEPYRGVLFLRYFEEQSPSAIAVRLGRSAKTVKTQLARGLQILRERLHDLQDEHGAWAPLLIAFAKPTGAPRLVLPAPPPTLLFSLLAMKKLLAVVVTLALVAATWITVTDDRDTGDAAVLPDERVDEASVVVLEADPEVEGVEATGARARVDVPDNEEAIIPATADGETSLRVRVAWPDGGAAAGVAVILSPEGKSRSRRRFERQITDLDGVACFEHLMPGTFELRADRGGEGGEQALELEAGERREINLQLLAGVEVAGRVLNEDGAPVAAASVWLTSPTSRWTSGRVVTKSDENGRFALRDVPDSQSIAAMAPGFHQSLPVDLDLVDTTAQPVEITLVLGLGGASLVGRVIDSEGVPVPGALVSVGEGPGYLDLRPDETIAERIDSRTVRADAEGTFRVDSLKAGEVRVRVRASGAPLWSSLVQIVASETHELEVRLALGASVNGVVRDATGAPLEGAWVHAFEVPLDETFLSSGQIDYEGAFRHPVGVSDSDGRYSVTNVTPGSVYLYALSPQKRDGWREQVSYDKCELELAPAESAAWDPTLEDGNVIAGSVLYQNGEPMTGVFVSARPVSGGTRRVFYTEDGAFRFTRLENEPHDVRAQVWDLPEGASEPQLEGVVPNGEPIRLIADFDPPALFETAEVRVRFEDTAGRAEDPSRVSVVLEFQGRLSWWGAESQGEDWRFEVSSPGSVRAVALLGERTIAIGDYVQVDSGGSYDLELSSRPGGTLLVRFERDADHPPEDWQLWIDTDASRRHEQIDIGPELELRLDSLEPGPGKMKLLGSNVVDLEAEFKVVAGEERVVTLRPQAAIGVPYVVSWTSGGEDKALTIRISHRDSGEHVVNVEADDRTRFQNPIRWTATLAPGAYTFEAFTGVGPRHFEEFEVKSLDPAEVPTLEADLH